MQYELSPLKHQDKKIDFSLLNQSLKKNIVRLLGQQTISVNHLEDQESIFTWFYIDPLSPFVLTWNIIYILLFYIVQLQISLELAFGPTFIKGQLQLANYYLPIYIVIIIYNSLDIALNFFKGYYAFGRGKVIDQPRDIVRHYLKTQFYFDVIFVLIYLIPLYADIYGLNFVQLIAAGIIWIKKFKYQAQIISFMEYYPTLRIFFMLVILFIDVLMIGNYGACIFVGMDILLYKAQYYGSNTAYYWLTNNTSYPLSLINGPWYYQYIYAQEFATGTLSTLAPGPFAKNPLQAIYAIVIMIFFMVLASYVGEVLIQIVFTYTERRVFHEDNIISFDNFMQLKSVQKTIRNRIYNFFELIWQVQLKMQSREQQNIINKLPTYLKQQLLLEIGFTKSIYFLKYLPNEKVLHKKIAMKIERMTLDSNTCIFEIKMTTHNNYKNRNLFFIKQGLAKFYIDDFALKKRDDNQLNLQINNEIVLNLSNVNRIVGLYQFVTGQHYSICCKTIDLCLVQKLSIDNFMQIIMELQIWEQFKELQHKVLIQQDLALINKICVLCQQPHLQSNCPEIYYRKKIESNKSKELMMGKQHERRPRKRRQLKSKKIFNQQNQYKDPNATQQQNILLKKLFQPLNISKLILDITKMQAQNNIQIIQQVYIFRNYYNTHNLV